MRGHVSSHVSSITLTNEENTVEKKHFTEGMCHGQTVDNVPMQPHTCVPLRNQQPSIQMLDRSLVLKAFCLLDFNESTFKMVYNKECRHCSWMFASRMLICFYFNFCHRSLKREKWRASAYVCIYSIDANCSNCFRALWFSPRRTNIDTTGILCKFKRYGFGH